MYDMKVLQIILQEPVTYKAVSQMPYFTLYGLYTYTHTYVSTPIYTLSPANLHKHPHTCIEYMATYENFHSPMGKIYGIIFQEHDSIFSFIFIKKCGF